jgi:acyl-CoA synthetase (NDP forming)
VADQATARRPDAGSALPNIERFLKPRSIAIVGAAPEPYTIGGGVLHNLETFGYAGDLHLVSRSRSEIRGRPCVRSIDRLPHGVDVVVLIVPQAAVRESVAACIEGRVGGVIVYTSGFAEAGEDGRREQDALAELCRASDIILLGPNCMGYINFVDGIPLTFEPIERRDLGTARRIAIIAQSGATAANIRLAMHGRELAVSYVITTGNEAVQSAEDFLEYLIEDDANAVIALYVEQIRDPARFLSVAARARARGKPIVMMHPGSSEKGKQSAQSHTGALAGDYLAMQTAIRNEAVALVETTEELFDVTAILSRFPTPKPGKVAIVTNSGAVRGISFDFCEKIGLPVADLTPATKDALRALLPAYVPADNPLDIGTTGFAQPSIFGTSTAAMLDDPDVGMVLLAHVGGSPVQQVAKSDHIVPVATQATKPVLVTILGDEYPLDERFMTAIRGSGLPFFRSPERAMRAMAAVSSYAEALAAVAARAPAGGQRLRLPGRGVIAEHEGKRILNELGIRTPKGALVTTVEEAAAAAGRIGYPVVLKAQAAALAHKSDAGGVIVGLADEAALRQGWHRLLANVEKAKPGLILDGVLVEEMAPQGLEMVVGARRDPQWGPVVIVGLGGVWIEALRDVKLLPADIHRERAIAQIRELKGASLLGRFRGAVPRDVAAVADVVVRLGAIMRGTPELTEVDLNPLVVYAEGEGVIALDALFVADGD